MSKSKPVAKGLIGIGFVSLIFGIGGAIVELILGLHQDIRQSQVFTAWGKKSGPDWLQAIGGFIKDIIEAAIDLILVLRESPLWLSLTVIGIVLILLGSYLMPEKPYAKTEQ